MNKTKKPKIKTKEKEKKVKIVDKKKLVHEVEEEEETLPEDVQEALGIKRQAKPKIKEVDYIAELENGDDFGIEDTHAKSSFEDEFDSDID